MEKAKVHYNSKEAAKRVDGISGWIDSSGRFWGDNEHAARYSSCTHLDCPECGKEMPRGWTICEDCREVKRAEKFSSLPRVEWDGKTPIVLDDGDQFFFSSCEVENFVWDNSLKVEDLQFRLCRPVKISYVEECQFLEELHEDAELPDKILDAIDALNKAIDDSGVLSWEPDNIAAIVKI